MTGQGYRTVEFRPIHQRLVDIDIHGPSRREVRYGQSTFALKSGRAVGRLQDLGFAHRISPEPFGKFESIAVGDEEVDTAALYADHRAIDEWAAEAGRGGQR